MISEDEAFKKETEKLFQERLSIAVYKVLIPIFVIFILVDWLLKADLTVAAPIRTLQTTKSKLPRH